MEKRLYRSRDDRMISGVCGGFGHYFGLDPVLMRVIAVILGFISFGTALLLYILLALIIPLEPERSMTTSDERSITGDQ